MGMDNHLVDNMDTDGNGMQELGSAIRVLIRLDLDLSYFSEKLVNLHVLLMHVWARENVFEVMALENEHISADSMEKALVFDLLSGILDSEVKELENFMDTLQAELADAHQKISSCSHLRELFGAMEEKLLNCEESLKQSQEQVLKMNMQLAKFQSLFLSFEYKNGENDKDMASRDNGQLSNVNLKLKIPTVRQQRHILRVLDKSLKRELDLEKKLLEIRQSEEELKLKMQLTEQVGFCMEEAADVIYGRFLEADNVAEVLMGISKDLVGQLQVAQFNLNGSIQREAEAKSKLLDCMVQLKAKETALEKLEKIHAEAYISQREQTTRLTANFDESEVFILKENIKLLEEQLKESKLQLENAYAYIEASEHQLSKMENIIESLKESISKAESKAEKAESKAEIAEGKITLLTETNLELTEEMGFLKDSTTEKVSSLEEKLRELGIQLQHAKASSEASQEQQNMLYSAIWDMETLIEELKSKVAKAESKTEDAEEQHIILSETNSKLNKELSFLRDKTDLLEKTLHQVKGEKIASAEDISIKTRLIMDMVIQLAAERERIQKQIYSLTEDNRILVEKIQKAKKDASGIMYSNGNGDEKDFPFFKHNSATAMQAKTSKETLTDFLSRSQVDEPSKDSPEPETEDEKSVSAKDAADVVSEVGAVRGVGKRQLNLIYVFMVILVSLIPVAIYSFNKKLIMFDFF